MNFCYINIVKQKEPNPIKKIKKNKKRKMLTKKFINLEALKITQ